jgi:hypothetical protein
VPLLFGGDFLPHLEPDRHHRFTATNHHPGCATPKGASPVALRAPCNAPFAANREINRNQNRQYGYNHQKLHILEQREHSFWANVNSDSDGTLTLILVERERF